MPNSTLGAAGQAIVGAFVIAACIILRPLLRPWYSKWGATIDELTQSLPGDEYVPNSRSGYTQAINIRASASFALPLE
jgi:hypothetical protein